MTVVVFPIARQDVSGATIEHPVADTIDDVPSVIRENTTQDAENAEESPPAVTDEEPIDPFTDVQVPQAVSENITASTVGEAAEESPPAVPDRSVDVAVLDLGTPQAVADRSVNADGIEGEATGVPPPSVPNGTLDETPVLVVEDESTGVIDNAAVMSSTGDEPQDEGIIEQQPIAAVSQAGEVTEEQENSPPTPKAGEEAITQEVVAAPADSSSALDTGVGAMPEMDEADQTSVVPEVSSSLVLRDSSTLVRAIHCDLTGHSLSRTLSSLCTCTQSVHRLEYSPMYGAGACVLCRMKSPAAVPHVG